MHVSKRSLSLTLAVAATAFAATPMAANAASGKALYSQHCEMCHGQNGKGSLPAAPNFTKHGGVLTHSDAVLKKRVLNGYKQMPAMKSQLSASQVEKVLKYIHKAFGPAS